MKTFKIYAMLVFLVMLSSCEKVVLDTETSSENSEVHNVTIHATHISQEPFDTRGSQQAVSEVATRLTCSIFQNSKKVKNITQTSSDDNFGSISLDLDAGSYEVVIIAHNGASNCTVSSPEKITFANNKTTDTFYYYGTLDVSDQTVNKEVTLQRAVAMFKLSITDDIPENAATIEFKYTGGSSTFDATSGYGNVNSKQTETRTMSTDTKDYCIYTFPHSTEKKLSIDVTVYDSGNQGLYEYEFDDIPITRNKITTYSGALFGGSGNSTGGSEETSGSDNKMTIYANGDWDAEDKYRFELTD